MAIDQQDIKNKMQLDLMTRMLKNQVEKEVEDRILEEVMPGIKKNIKAMAKEAVSKWAVNMSMQKDMTAFGNVDKVMVQFVEEIVHKHSKDGIKIEEV